MHNTILETRNLSIGYKSSRNETVLYRDLNAQLKKGELTCLLGKNGSGKSTLLRSLCSLLPTLSGEVIIAGKEKGTYSIREISKLVSIVLTDTVRTEDMTAYEVIALGRTPYTGFWGKLDDADTEKIDQSIALIGIADLVDRKMQTLSDGERQKVMIAKAVVQETPIILMDEPSAFLDYASKIKLLQLLRTLTRKLGKTVLISSHDMEHMLQVAEQAWLLDKELGFAHGPTHELCHNGTIGKYFNLEGICFDQKNCRFDIDLEKL